MNCRVHLVALNAALGAGFSTKIVTVTANIREDSGCHPSAASRVRGARSQRLLCFAASSSRALK
jgi:hypothetical protein